MNSSARLLFVLEPWPTAAAKNLRFWSEGQQNERPCFWSRQWNFWPFSLLTIEEDIFTVSAAAADNQLGGREFVHRLFDYSLKNLDRFSWEEISINQRARHRLTIFWERTMPTLSVSTRVRIDIDKLCEDLDFYSIIPRAKAEDLCMEYFKWKKKDDRIIVERPLYRAYFLGTEYSIPLIKNQACGMLCVLLIETIFGQFFMRYRRTSHAIRRQRQQISKKWVFHQLIRVFERKSILRTSNAAK